MMQEIRERDMRTGERKNENGSKEGATGVSAGHRQGAWPGTATWGRKGMLPVITGLGRPALVEGDGWGEGETTHCCP